MQVDKIIHFKLYPLSHWATVYTNYILIHNLHFFNMTYCGRTTGMGRGLMTYVQRIKKVFMSKLSVAQFTNFVMTTCPTRGF